MAEYYLPLDATTPKYPKNYALSGQLMLGGTVILLLVILLMVCIHFYARWYLLRERRRLLLRRRSRLNNPTRAHVVLYVDNTQTAMHGLEPAVVNSLPVFVYSTRTKPEGLECAVCLSEFEDNEKGRFLPKCKHSFHIECIDMWFRSHSTCPICRAVVEPVVDSEGIGIEPSTSSEEGSQRKGLDLTAMRIEVPSRSELENGLQLSSPASHGFRSPGTRLLSFKRMLSMGRKTPTGDVGTSCSSGTAPELDLEGGPAELTRALTPR